MLYEAAVQPPLRSPIVPGFAASMTSRSSRAAGSASRFFVSRYDDAGIQERTDRLDAKPVPVLVNELD